MQKAILKIMCVIGILTFCFVVLFSYLPFASEDEAEFFEPAYGLNSGTTYYKSGDSFFTLSQSVAHYKCTNSSHSGDNDYTTSSVSGDCYYRSGYYYDCSTCGGDGWISSSYSCGSCSGSGNISSSSTCSSCNGAGGSSSSCSSCGGDGERGYGHSWSGGSCSRCGIFSIGFYDTTCYTGSCGSCGGDGRTNETTCGTCGGDGQTTSTSSCSSCGGDGRISSSSSCSSCGGDGEHYSSGYYVGHSISLNYTVYTYTNIDTAESATTQTAYSVATGYTVTFNGNGADTGSMNTQYFLHGHSQALNTNLFAKDKHMFLGWSTSSSATEATYTNGQAVTQITSGTSATLYAVWIYRTKNLTFAVNGGGSISLPTGTAEYAELDPMTVYAYANAGYMFSHWVRGSDGAEIKSNPLEFVVTADESYTAVFVQNTYPGFAVTATTGGEVMIVGDDFASLADTDTITLVATITDERYKFSHWEDNLGNNLGADMSIRLTKAQMTGVIVKAVFVLL